MLMNFCYNFFLFLCGHSDCVKRFTGATVRANGRCIIHPRQRRAAAVLFPAFRATGKHGFPASMRASIARFLPVSVMSAVLSQCVVAFGYSGIVIV